MVIVKFKPAVSGYTKESVKNKAGIKTTKKHSRTGVELAKIKAGSTVETRGIYRHRQSYGKRSNYRGNLLCQAGYLYRESQRR